MLSDLQKKTAQAIVNIFESGRPLGDYGCVTIMKGDTGHLTYGRSQTTLASGNLALLLHDYCDSNGLLSERMKPFLAAFDGRDPALDNNEDIKSILRQAGEDPVMRKTQDAFFDRVYWAPALKSADNIKVKSPLGITVIYDSKIQGSYGTIRELTVQRYGEVDQTGEKEWIKAYVSVRKEWLANNINTLLHKTTYRMDSISDMIAQNKWDLPLPLTVRNVVISEDLFRQDYQQPVVISAASGERVLFLTEPKMTGVDVVQLQKALNFPANAIDGVFGADTDSAVRSYQKTHGLKVDGKVGSATWSALGY